MMKIIFTIQCRSIVIFLAIDSPLLLKESDHNAQFPDGLCFVISLLLLFANLHPLSKAAANPHSIYYILYLFPGKTETTLSFKGV